MQGEPGERAGRTAEGEIRRLVAEIVRLRISYQTDRLADYFAEDVVYYYNCYEDCLFRPGVLEGRNALREHLRRADIDYEPLDGEILDILVEGEKAAVRWRSLWRHRGTGLSFTMDMAHFLRWRDGLVVEMHEFLDHHSATMIDRCGGFQGFDALLTPRPPGLNRHEILQRLAALIRYPSHEPDVSLIRKLCAPDIVCEFVGDRARIPYSGRHMGVEALVRIVRSIAVDFQQLRLSLTEVVVDGGKVAVRRAVEWRHRGTGRTGVVHLADFLRFEDGLIVELIEFRDTVTLLEMQGEMGEQ